MTTEATLQALPGLEAAKRVVRRLSASDAGVHAVLLYGAEGGGASALARALAQAWLCQNPTQAGACGECQACRSFLRGKSSDLVVIEPTGPSRMIRIGSISGEEAKDGDADPNVRDFFRTTPLMAKRKIVIIEEAERMNSRAANALLKTLEEPFPHARLILTSQSVGNVLATIRSRCLSVACGLPEIESLKKTFPDATEDDIRMAEGAPGRLEEILRNPTPYRDLAELARSLPQRKRGEALVLGELLRAIAERFESAKAVNARAAHAEALSLLAAWTARDPKADPKWTQALVEAHRRIVQNGSVTFVLDGTFAKMLPA